MARRIAILLLIPLLVLVLAFVWVEIWIAGYKAVDARRAEDLRKQTADRVARRQAATPLPSKNSKPADLLAGLEKALADPNFVPPSDPLVLRGLSDSLVAHAATLPPDQALRCLLLALELSARVQNYGTTTTMLVGTGMQRSVDKALFDLMASGKLSAADNKLLGQRVRQLDLGPETMVERMDEDYLAFMEYTSSQAGANSFTQQVLILTPGFVAREQTLYQNMYLRDRDSIAKEFKLTGPPGELQQLKDKDNAFLVALSYPLYPKIRLQFARALTELSALEAMAKLDADKKYPAKLEARDYLAEDGKFDYRPGPKGYTLRSGYKGSDIEAESLKFR